MENLNVKIAESVPLAASVAALAMFAERYLSLETAESHKMALEMSADWKKGGVH